MILHQLNIIKSKSNNCKYTKNEQQRTKRSHFSKNQQLEEAENSLLELMGKSIPAIVEIMTRQNKTELNLHEYDRDGNTINKNDGMYYTGWDEGEYDCRRLFVYDGRLYLAGKYPFDCADEFTDSVMNLSSTHDCRNYKLRDVIGGIILNLLDENDDIYNYTNFEDGYERVDMDSVEESMEYFDENDRK